MSLLTFADLLDLLGHDGNRGDHVALCTSSGGVFSSNVVTAKHARNYTIPTDRDAWFSVNPMQGPPRLNAGRGDVSQVVRLSSVYADLDVKPGGLADFDTANAVIADLSIALHVRPSAITWSGNGVQPYWPLEDEISGPDAMALLRRWGRLVRHFAGLHGGQVDSVFDLTRILRIPGSFNHKDPNDRKPVVCIPDAGRPLTVQEIIETLDQHNIPEVDEDKQQVGDPISAPSGWQFGQETCHYVQAMVSAWATESPNARHPWLVNQATRLAAAFRLSCITGPDYANALIELQRRFTELLSQAPQRKEALGEIRDALAWGRELVAAKTDEAVWQEIGKHTHVASHPSSGQAPPPPGLPPDKEEAFWNARPFLSHIREFALARMVSPWSLLGVCILRMLATVPPWVVLPPIIGGYGSLNLFVALVGPSGVGKGGTDRAARECLFFTGIDIYTAPVGSGEGIAHQYAHREGKSVVTDRISVLFEVPEVDNLTALGSRQGSTLLSQLRLAFSGERLGFGYADAVKRLPIEADTYRLCLGVGVQPERAGAIIWDADGGTPQRFIWLPATDPNITATPPLTPPPLVIDPQDFKQSLGTRYLVLPVPDSVEQMIREEHAKRASGTGDALDGHALFAREKVAQALTFLDARRTMTEEDWELAGVIMQKSDETRGQITWTLESKQRKTDTAKAIRQADVEHFIEEQKLDRTIQRIGVWICKKAGSNGGMSLKDLRHNLPSRDRGHFEDAIDWLIDEAQIEVVNDHVTVKK